MSCLFCKIVAGEIPAKRVHEDDDVVAFEDINPQAPLHVLVIPKRHIATLNDLQAGDDGLVGDDGATRRGHRQRTRLRRQRLSHRVQLQQRRGADGVSHPPAVLGGRRLAWPPG